MIRRSVSIPVFAVALVAFFPTLAVAEESALEKRLAALERRVLALEKENAALRAGSAVPAPVPAPPPRPAPPAVAEAPKKETGPKVEVGGFVQAQGEAGDAGDSRWEGAGDRVFLRRARLGVSAGFPEGFDAELEGELSGSLAPAGSLRARLTDAMIHWNRYSFLTVKIGQFKSPFGYEEITSDKKLYTPERSLPSDQLTLGRQIGAQLAGSVAGGNFAYTFAAFNGHGTNTTANPDDRFLLVGRVNAKVPLGKIADLESSIGAGFSTYSSDDTAVALPADFGFDSTPSSAAKDALFTGKRRGFEFDSQFRFGPIELWGEFLKARFEPADALPAPVVESDGWSALLVWHAAPKVFSVVGKYEVFDPRHGTSGDDTRDFTLGTNWFVRGNELKLQLDWMRTEIGDGPPSDKAIARIQAVF